MKQSEENSPRTSHIKMTVSFLFLLLILLGPDRLFAQHADSIRTGYMLDAAEEYWPKTNENDLLDRSKHIPVRDDRGFFRSAVQRGKHTSILTTISGGSDHRTKTDTSQPFLSSSCMTLNAMKCVYYAPDSANLCRRGTNSARNNWQNIRTICSSLKSLSWVRNSR